MLKFIRSFFLFVLLPLVSVTAAEPPQITAPAPLVMDPIFGDSGDPTLIFNHNDHLMWAFYTQRRDGSPHILRNTVIAGTDIGIASSPDGGQHWYYRGVAEFPDDSGKNTYWAPEVIWHDGVYHMFVTFLEGVIVTSNDGKSRSWPASIVHYTSSNLFQWKRVGKVALSSKKTIDAVVHPLPGGGWRMWYKDEIHNASIWCADSPDLKTWTVVGSTVKDRRQEGPFVFEWRGAWWMICDWWKGLGVYRSDDQMKTWVPQEKTLLLEPGKRLQDDGTGGHCCVLVQGDRAFIVYQCKVKWIQVAELKVSADGKLTCDRDAPFDFNPKWELAPEYRGGGNNRGFQ